MKVLVYSQNKNKRYVISGVKKAGFTLIELLVVLAIFTLVMGIALFNQAGLNSNIMITNLAYETALAVREAQTYGVGVRASGATFDKGYGAYFDMSTPYQFVVFGDSDINNTYISGAMSSELQSLYEVRNQRGNKIKAICVGNKDQGSGAQVPCTALGSNAVSKLSIMFRRPNPEASFWVEPSGGGDFEKSIKNPAVIVVNNVDNSNCRAIIIEVTGQIRVENSSGVNCKNGPQ
jgi:prepilin-type N-terminal cleavage/methylation domain-containing protein